MGLLYQSTFFDSIALNLSECVYDSGSPHFCRKSNTRSCALGACLLMVCVAGCANDTGEVSSANTVATSTIVVSPQASESDVILEDQSSSSPIQSLSNSDELFSSPTATALAEIDQSGIAATNNDLTQLLSTDFVVENQQLVPTTGWICADSIGQSRTYYFYQNGVLDESRNIAIERTLNVNNTHSDITFFWYVLTTDALIMTSVNRDDSGLLLSSGRQYDVSSIRFQEIESRQTFTAESVLRGKLVCGDYALR